MQITSKQFSKNHFGDVLVSLYVFHSPLIEVSSHSFGDKIFCVKYSHMKVIQYELVDHDGFGVCRNSMGFVCLAWGPGRTVRIQALSLTHYSPHGEYPNRIIIFGISHQIQQTMKS